MWLLSPVSMRISLKTCGGNGLHFFFHLGKVKTGPVNLVVAVEAAVDAVIFAVVC